MEIPLVNVVATLGQKLPRPRLPRSGGAVVTCKHRHQVLKSPRYFGLFLDVSFSADLPFPFSFPLFYILFSLCFSPEHPSTSSLFF